MGFRATGFEDLEYTFAFDSKSLESYDASRMAVRTRLLTIDEQIRAPYDVVYSTDPRRAEGANHLRYFIKGPELEIVFAEIAGCLLAREVGLIVPDVAACEFAGETYAGSVKVDEAVRDIEPWLNRPQRVTNFDDVFRSIVVDLWLANKDRNIGNILGDPRPGRGRIDLVFIDFEKSATLRQYPMVRTPLLDPRELWPSGILGAALRRNKPLIPPADIIDRIRSLTDQRYSEIVNEVEVAINVEIEWKDGCVGVLSQRGAQIRQLSEALWAMNQLLIA